MIIKAGDRVRVKRGSFETRLRFEVQEDDDGQFVTIDGERIDLGTVEITNHVPTPISIAVTLPRETSWTFMGGAAGIVPNEGGALIWLGEVSGVIDDVDIERAAGTLLAILQTRQ